MYVCNAYALSIQLSGFMPKLTILLQEDSSLNSVAWSVDIDTDEPLVCVAGSGSKNIKIWNVATGELVRVSLK
jgi:WD40 repeat protein